MLSIDYTQRYDLPRSQFMIDRTFSWIDWAIAKNISEGTGSFSELMSET